MNDLGQRTVQATAGDAFSTVNRGWNWYYNSSGEVVKATHAASSTLNRTYAFDSIGNRRPAAEQRTTRPTRSISTPRSVTAPAPAQR